MEVPDEIVWFGGSKIRFIERALERESFGNYNGNLNLGKRLVQEVQDKISEITYNLNLYQQRNDEDRVAPLSLSGYVLIYRKEYFQMNNENKIRLVIIDIRKSF